MVVVTTDRQLNAQNRRYAAECNLAGFNFFCLDADGVFARFECTTRSRGIDLGEFGSEKEDLRRIVNPE